MKLDCARDRHRQRALASYYTPLPVAETLTSWAIRDATDNVLDPSFGGCAFFLAAIARLSALGSPDPFSQLGGFDVDRTAKSYVQALPGYRPTGRKIRVGYDFLATAPRDVGGDFTTIVGNPPYIRHHSLSKAQIRVAQSAVRISGFEVRKTSSYWVYFVLHSVAFLQRGGRLAMVLPFAALNAEYARPVRASLASRFSRTTFIHLRERVFNDAQEGSVILLAEGCREKHRDTRVTSAATVRTIQRICAGKHRFKKRTSANSSITCLPSADGILNRLQRRSDVHHLSSLATVRIGIVTGDNSFFVMSKTRARRLQLTSRYLRRIVTRSQDLRSLEYTVGEPRGDAGAASFLFLAPLKSASTPVLTYLGSTRAKRAEKRYKSKLRRPWYRMSDLQAPDAFLSYVNGRTPKLVLNPAGVLCTNAIHRLFWKRRMAETEKRMIALSFLSTLGAVSAELQGRSYGGGVLKIEPGAARRLLIALPSISPVKVRGAFHAAHQLATEGKWNEARVLADRLILRDGLHLTRAEVTQLRRGLSKLKRLRVPS